MIKGSKGGAVAVSFVASLREQDYWGFNLTAPGVDAEGKAIELQLDPVVEGVYQSDGLDALCTDLSIGTGRGSAKVQISGRDLREITPILKSYNPDAPSGSARTVAEIVKATLNRDDDHYSFKVSDAKNSRTVKVPIDSWPKFLEFIGEMNDEIETKIEQFRDLVVEMAKQEREANRK